MSKTLKTLSKAEQYVLAKIAAEKLYAALTPEERIDADKGMGWAETLAYGTGNGARRPGRPKGSRAKPKGLTPGQAALKDDVLGLSEGHEIELLEGEKL